MSFNKNNHDDIIDAEFVVDGRNQKPAPKSFAWNMNNKNGASFKKPNFLVLLLLSPIILVLLVLAAVVFLLAFILFMPKIIRLFKYKNQLLRNLGNLRQKQS